MFELTSRMHLYPNRWCVYAHYIGGTCIYVGMGRPERAFSPHKRSGQWRELTAAGFEVCVLHWAETREEAEYLERKEIKAALPACNIVHTGRQKLTIPNPWGVGCKHSDASKRVMSERQKASWARTKRAGGRRKPRRPIRCVETGVVYDGLREAARQNDLCPASISMCVNGRTRSAGGLTFVREG